jgi:hypothetical protein
MLVLSYWWPSWVTVAYVVAATILIGISYSLDWFVRRPYHEFAGNFEKCAFAPLAMVFVTFEKYAVWLRVKPQPTVEFFSALFSSVLLSGVFWIPWLLWNGFWVLGTLMIPVAVMSRQLAVRWNPVDFLATEVKKSAARLPEIASRFAAELAVLLAINEGLEQAHPKPGPPEFEVLRKIAEGLDGGQFH